MKIGKKYLNRPYPPRGRPVGAAVFMGVGVSQPPGAI